MAIDDSENPRMAAVKASLKDSGALRHLKDVVLDKSQMPQPEELHELRQQAKTVIEQIEQALNGARLDDAATQKLSNVLMRLKASLSKDGMSPGTLATVLAEAAAAVNAVDGAGQGSTPEQRTAQLWHKVETYNKEIDDDFGKMKKAGVVFNEKLFNRHKELSKLLQAHPHDLATQKELDAVDDVLLMQAEPQLIQKPEAKTAFDDAKYKSDDRHEEVDKDLADRNQVNSNAVSAATLFDDPNTEKLSLNDVKSPRVGQRQKSDIKYIG